MQPINMRIWAVVSSRISSKLQVRTASILIGAVLTVALAGISGIAQARVTHESIGQIATVPNVAGVEIPGALEEVKSLALSEGQLFVTENVLGRRRTDQFNATDRDFISQLPQPSQSIAELDHGVAVGGSAGSRTVYIGGATEVALYSEASPNSWSFEGVWEGFSIIRGIAVDNSSSLGDPDFGDVYVADRGTDSVDVLKPEGGTNFTEVARIEGTAAGHPFAAPIGVVVDEADGYLFVVDEVVSKSFIAENEIDVFRPNEAIAGSYEFVTSLNKISSSRSLGAVLGVAVDGGIGQGSGNVYVAASTLNVQSKTFNPYSVLEFNPSLELVGEIKGFERGYFTDTNSVAVDPDNHDVLVGDNTRESPPKSAVDVFGSDVIIPDSTGEAPTGITFDHKGGWGVDLKGELNPDNAGTVTCTFIWSAVNSSERHDAPCEGPGEDASNPIPSGSSPVHVEAKVEGLLPGEEYKYLLVATNSNGSTESEEVDFSTPGPTFNSEWTSAVSSSAARLNATITKNSLNASISYFFEYGRTNEYGSSLPIKQLGAEEKATAQEEVKGLEASSEYHYRVVAVAEVEPEPESRPGVVEDEEFASPDHVFSTQSAIPQSGLIDGRSWELVTPSDKRGGLVLGLNQPALAEGVTQAAASGKAITFLTEGPVESDVQGTGSFEDQAVSKHTAEGWSSEDITPPRDDPDGLLIPSGYQFFSEDLTSAFLLPLGEGKTILAEGLNEATPYIRNNSACKGSDDLTSNCLTPLILESNVPSGVKFGKLFAVSFSDATPDLKNVFLASNLQLTNIENHGDNELYAWHRDAGADAPLELISVLPESEGGGPSTTSGVGIGNEPQKTWASGYRPISEDGSRVFWSTANVGAEQLYVRDLTLRQSLRLDVPQEGFVPNGKPSARFEGASSDGSRVYFTDSQRLFPESSVVGADLYECKLTVEAGALKCALTDLTPESSNGPSEVQNLILGVSDDGSYIYFVANGTLPDSGAQKQGTCKPEVVGQASCNLYVAHNGTVKFIASLSDQDETDWGEDNPVLHTFGNQTARVSANGQFVVFMSDAGLTGYDSRDAISGRPDQEVYLYDASKEKLSCVSCNPTGARPVGSELEDLSPLAAPAQSSGSLFTPSAWVASNIPAGDYLGGFGAALYQTRVLSDTGRVFFDSTDALVPGDINGSEDVYEWEPAGVGDCTRASSWFTAESGGCVGLISSGTGVVGSGFLDASASGSDVFFVSGTQLVKKDVDTALDVYDAHVCGSEWGCADEPPEVPLCTNGDSCRSASAPQPTVFGAPASELFEGEGNIASVTAKPLPKSKLKPKSLSKRQKLARALKTCHKRKRGLRRSCKRAARKRYKATERPGRNTHVSGNRAPRKVDHAVEGGGR